MPILSLHILCDVRSNVSSQKVPDQRWIVIRNIFSVLLQHLPGVSLDGGAIWADEELLKVPCDVCPLDRPPDQELRVGHQALRVIAGDGQRLLQELEDRMLIFAIGLNLWIINLRLYMKIAQALCLKSPPCQTILLWTQTHFQVWHASERLRFLVHQNFLGGQTKIF